MKILAFLQNQWFRDPVRVRAIYDRNPELRNELIRRFLFGGCLTGRRLLTALGEDLCRQHITWEEISPEIGGHSSSKFPADLDHITAAIRKFDPDLILAFGSIAQDALKRTTSVRPRTIIFGPHPAARTNPMPRLNEIGQELRTIVNKL
jgi:hypothetical protein